MKEVEGSLDGDSRTFRGEVAVTINGAGLSATRPASSISGVSPKEEVRAERAFRSGVRAMP
jgi:hypothetical protein